MFRRTAFPGAERAVALDAPLGGPEFGFDSLTLVELLTALENAFDIELDRSVWAEQRDLSLGYLIDRIAEKSPASRTHPTQDEERRAGEVSAIEPSARPRLEEERAETRRRWAMSARLARAARSLRSRQEYLVLERDLARPTPKLDPDPALELRLATADDVDGVVEIFGPRRRERNAAELRRRIEAGYLCLGAFRDGHWAGIDYVTSSRHRHGFLNLVVSPRDGHAYAFGLHEDPRLRGMGVGLRLLAASIDLSRERGDRKQFTIVQRDNERMLSASIQIFGFEVVGRLACDRIAVSARTTGEVHGTPLKGRVLYL